MHVSDRDPTTKPIQPYQPQEGALPLSQSVLNVGVDVGVLAACLWAWNFENKLKQQTDM